MAEGPRDPWRIVAELVESDPQRQGADPTLTVEIERAMAPFAGRSDSVSDLVDDLERRSFVDVDAPVESARPIVPQLKLAVRKANAFLARHLAQQVTVLTQTTAAAIRQLHERVSALEAQGEIGEVLEHLLDHRDRFTERLAALTGSGLRRDVGDPRLLASLPPSDAALVVLWGFVDVTPSTRLKTVLEQALAGVAEGGHVAVVGTVPEQWAAAALPLVVDLAPGRPLQDATLAHLLRRAGATDVDVSREGPAVLVVGHR